jgi:hypothetical protein
MPTYNPLVPSGTIPLNQDYLNLQNNFNKANSSFGTDHYAFDNASANNGYHSVAHFVAVSIVSGGNPTNLPIPINIPAPVGLTGELFVAQTDDGINTDETLFWQSGGGKFAQLTRNFNPTISTNGKTYLPGGLILQWGKKTTPGNSGTITFSTESGTDNIAFPSNLFNVQLTLSRANTGGGSGVIVIDSSATFDKTKFSYISSTSGSVDLYWTALGN